MKEKKVVREERNKEKLTSGDWVMAEFYSIHSLKSSRMHAVIDEFKKLMGGKVEVVQVNVDEEKTLAEFYTIVHIPTYIFLRWSESCRDVLKLNRPITLSTVGAGFACPNRLS